MGGGGPVSFGSGRRSLGYYGSGSGSGAGAEATAPAAAASPRRSAGPRGNAGSSQADLFARLQAQKRAREGGGGGAPRSVSAPRITAQKPAALTALLDRYNTHLDKLGEGRGREMEYDAAGIRDAREGGRQALSDSEKLRRVKSSNRMGRYDATTASMASDSLSTGGLAFDDREGEAIRGGLGLAGAGSRAALAEKEFGLDSWQAGQAAANSSWQRERAKHTDAVNNWMQALQMQRSSPVYRGYA